MKLIHDSALCLLQLLLLAELFVQSSSHPIKNSSLCDPFRSMSHWVEKLASSSKKLHDLSDNELLNFATVENRLKTLPLIQHNAAYFSSLKVNESLSHLYEYTQSLKLHVDWLKKAKEEFSFPSQPAEGASTHLQVLSNLLSTSLQQMSEEVPQTASPSFPAASTAFDVLQFSVEISEQLQVFCNWSKRVLHHIQKLSHCPRK